MFFKNPFKKPFFTKEFYIVLIIAIFVLLFAAILLRSAHALKTEEIEIKEQGGSYDGNLLLTRDSSGNLVITTPAGTVKIKDGLIILSGNIIVDGTEIGITTDTDLITLSVDQVVLDASLIVKGGSTFGQVGNNGRIFILNAAGATVIDLDGTAGDATFKGGLNVGTASGAPAGSASFFGTRPILYLKDTSALGDSVVSYIDFVGSDDVRIALVGHPNSASDDLYVHADTGSIRLQAAGILRALVDGSTGNIDAYYGINVGSATGAGTGDVKASDDIIAEDNVLGFSHQITPSFTSLPAASADRAGTMRVLRDAGDGDRDKLYICLRSSGGPAYSWVLIAQGL